MLLPEQPLGSGLHQVTGLKACMRPSPGFGSMLPGIPRLLSRLLIRKRRMAAPIPPALARQNRLLRALSPETLRQLMPALEVVELPFEETLLAQDAPIAFVYFPLTGIVSLINSLEDGSSIEVAMMAHDDMVGLPRFLGAERMLFTALVQIPGEALRMRGVDFDRSVGQMRGEFSQQLFRYTAAFLSQLAQQVLCNQLHTIAQRCARWLLVTQDGANRAEFPLTQAFLSSMLGVRRASVTGVAGRLQQAGLIRYRQGTITVLDRGGLEAASCECYGIIKAAYDRLLGEG
jgi:CRP-like cAMP-binding protein